MSIQANSQFQIPEAPETPVELANTQIFGMTPVPATATREPYYLLKEVELEIAEMRALADETTIPRYRLTQIIQSVLQPLIARPTDSLERQLVDIESEIGGRLLKLPPGIESQRFWFHGEDWFYEMVDAKGPMYSRYHITDDAMYKLSEGKSIPFSPGEQEHLEKLIPRYFNAIRHELYERDELVQPVQSVSSLRDKLRYPTKRHIKRIA